ncbi:MAG: PAS domain-containing hybrid sensor histidine kinase/response regulator, partial [Thermoguttaceae bacterium]
MAVGKANEHRVLALAPNGRDARATCEILGDAGIAVTICGDMAGLCRELESGAGAVLLTNDALVLAGAAGALAEALGGQPRWSDLPVLLLASGGANSAIALAALEALPNVLVLDRPVHLPTLLSAVKTALRSRERQYELRDHLRELERTEKRLRASEERLVLAQEAGGVGVFDWDVVSGDVVWTSQLEKVYGMAMPEEPKERHDAWVRHVHPADRPGLLEGTRRWLDESDESDHQWEYRFIRPDGEERWIAGRSSVCRDSQNRPLRVVGTNVDITKRKGTEQTLRESEEKFRTFFQNAAVGATQLGLDNRFLEVNDQFCRITGFDHDELLGMTPDDLTHPEDRPQASSLLSAYLSGQGGGAYHVEKRYVRKDGRVVWVEVTAALVRDPDGTPVCSAGIIQDVTERKRIEETLREDDRRKDEFLAMLGHELRNPLAAITTGLRLLRSPHAEQHEWVKQSLEHQTRQLVALVDDLLDISRITRGKIQLRSEIVDLRTVAQNAAESTTDLMVEKKHAFTLSCPEAPLPVLGDPTRLQQIVANLVNNAAKYTPDEGRIELKLERVGDEAVICVKDNGLGIPADMQGSIFELFGQVDSATHRPQQGLGIGLSLVKMLVGLHGGSVAVASEGAGKGSTFTVRLPAVETTEALKEDRGRNATADGELFDILLVEDNHQVAQMLKIVLEERSHAVRVAESGREAIRMGRASRPKVVILDIGLPDMSGYEVAQTLRQEPGYADTLIIAATGYGQERDRQRSREAGIDHHLVKPIEYETIALLAREWRRTVRSRGSAAAPAGAGRAASESAPEGRGARVLVIDDTRVIAKITQQMLQQEGH